MKLARWFVTILENEEVVLKPTMRFSPLIALLIQNTMVLKAKEYKNSKAAAIYSLTTRQHP